MNQADERETNKSLLLRLIEEGFNKGNLSVVDDIVSTEMKERQRGNEDGIGGTKEVIRTLRRWFPDLNMRMEDAAAVEDKVWMRFRATGTNLGPLMGRPPTGKKMIIDVIDIARFKDGRLVEHWGIPDQLGMMLQLGLAGGDRGGRNGTAKPGEDRRRQAER
jgi:predicted ester cyclase